MTNQHYRLEPYLPTELISLILGHIHPLDRIPTLYTCSLVSTQFYNIANPLLWNSTDFPCITVQRLLNCLNGQSSLALSPGRHIQHLILTGDSCSTNDDGHGFSRLLPHLRNLTHIQLSIQVTDMGIQKLAHYCPHIIHIELQGVTIESKNTFRMLEQYCSQIEELYLRNCTIVQPHALQPVLQGCSRFQKLTLESCKLDESTVVQDIIQYAHSMSYLRLAGLSRESIKSLFLLAATPLFGNALIYPLEKLTTLFILNGHGLDDSIWLGFIKTHPKIQDMTLRDGAMTDRGLVAMVTRNYLPTLKHLRFMRCPFLTSDGLRQMILHTGSTLLTLQCHHCSRIRSNHFPEICSPANMDPFDDCPQDDDIELNTTDMNDIRKAYNKEIQCI